MDLDLDAVHVSHNEKAHRFEADVDGLHALITYRRSPGVIVFDHTEVPSTLEGKGLAGKLARTALDFARAHNLRVVPLCPYVSGFIRKHKEYQDLVSPQDLQQLFSR